MAYLYKQCILLSDLPITGWYRYRDMFQILPPTASMKKAPYLIGGNKPCIFQWKSRKADAVRINSVTQEEIPDWVLDVELSSEVFREIVLVLGVISVNRISCSTGKQGWFIPTEREGDIEPIWGQESYFCREISANISSFSEVTGLDAIPMIPSNRHYNTLYQHMDNVFSLPEDITLILDAYFILSEVDKNAFLCASTLFEQGANTWSISPSLSFVGFVSCLETLVNVENNDTPVEKCEQCQQKKHQVTKKFLNFMLKYGNNDSTFKKFSNKIYKYRSEIVHSGQLLNGDLMPEKFGHHDSIEDDEFRRGVIRACRICMVNWLFERAKNTHPTMLKRDS
ncbi:hypothetical protein COOFOMLJ_00945 [Aeromonas veronii]